MYITQTYLGFSARRAKVYVYFLSERYMSDRQRDLHDVFLNRAKELGLSTNEQVAVVLPAPGFEMQVLGDIDDAPESPLQRLYKNTIRDHVPGLLVTRSPIDTKRGIEGAMFFSFNNAEHPFRAAKALIQTIVDEPDDGRLIKVLENLNEILILEPNWNGIGINLNAILEKAIEYLREKNHR